MESSDGGGKDRLASVLDTAAPRPSVALLEQLAGEVGKLRALTKVAESTKRRLTAELVELSTAPA